MKRSITVFFILLTAIPITVFSSFVNGGKEKFKGYKKMAGGSYFLLIKKGSGTTPVDTGGAMFLKIKFTTSDDSVFLDINESAKTPSYPMRIDKPAYKGDFLDLFTQLHVGDSASFFIRLDSLKSYYKDEFNTFEPKYDTMKYLGFSVKVDSIYSREKVEVLRKQAEVDEKKKQDELDRIQKVMQPIQDKAKEKEPMLKEKDFELLTKYIRKEWKGPKEPEPDGIFFHEIKAGTGDSLKAGMTVSVRYTGKYLDGTVFDSNTIVKDEEPLTFTIGSDQCIEGFMSGILKMKAGGKAVFIVPPALAYNDGLTRIFEVEIINVKTN